MKKLITTICILMIVGIFLLAFCQKPTPTTTATTAQTTAATTVATTAETTVETTAQTTAATTVASPTPTPAPTIAPTPNTAPTAKPTPKPTATPKPSPKSTASPKPTASPTPTTNNLTGWSKGETKVLKPGFACIGDVVVDGTIRYDIGGTNNESTIVVNSSTKDVKIYAEWGAGLKKLTTVDELVASELNKYSNVRLVIVTDTSTTETIKTK